MTLFIIFAAILMLQLVAQSDGKGEKFYAENALFFIISLLNV